MIVLVPVCEKDKDAALRNLAWALSLDGGKVPFTAIVSYERGFDASRVIKSAQEYFGSVLENVYAPYHSNPAWPGPQNWAWRQAASFIFCQVAQPWFWWEQDAVPLRKGWLGAIRDAYASSGKQFMGATGVSEWGMHLNGVAVYPPDVLVRYPELGRAAAGPFDVVGGKQVLDNALVSPLFQHVWTADGTGKGKPPTFGGKRDLQILNPEAVIFHRCKDGSLISALKSASKGETVWWKRAWARAVSANKSLDLITVVITNFKRPEKLAAAFESCATAGVRNVVVSSSGADAEIVRLHRQMQRRRGMRVQVTSIENDLGCNEAWLRGVKLARTDWVHILHDDDLLLPAFAILPNVIHRNPKAGFFHFGAVSHGASTPASFSACPDLETGTYPSAKLSWILTNPKARSLSPVSGLFHKEHLVQVLEECAKSFKGIEYHVSPTMMVGNDLLIWLRAVERYLEFGNVKESLVSFGHWEGSTTCKAVSTGGDNLLPFYNRVRDYAARTRKIAPVFLTDGRLDLSTVTLLAIEVVHPKEAVATLLETMAKAKFHDVVMLTDLTKYRPTTDSIRFVQHEETDFRPMTRGAVLDHEIACICKPAQHVNGASHVLFVEWDAGIRNPETWKPDWLKYDFIGAPWPPRNEPGWPPCTPENNVGNTGFSLRSAKFCALARQAADEHPDDVTRCVHDSWLCLTMRPWLVSHGVKFAPADVAAEFSNENRIHRNQFGFHGKPTFYLNHWGTPEHPVWRKR